MPDRAPELRTIVSAITAVVTLIALMVVAALFVQTARLQRASSALGAAVESVRLAEEAQIDLLLHARSADPLVRRQIEIDLLRRLSDASGFVTSEPESALLREAGRAVDVYLAKGREGGGPPAVETETAYAAIEALADLNVAQAREQQATTAGWAAFARAMGIVSAVLLLGVSGILVWWLNSRAFQPVFALAGAMQSFGAGDREVRATETGPAELRAMAVRFNEMASALAAQREAQMAFLGGVAHDLRGPLSTLRAALAIASPDRPLGTEEEVRRTLALVARQITRLERMVGDFLDRARIEAGQLDLDPADADLRTIVADVVELFRPASGPSHRIEVDLPAEPLVARCDPLRIEQVMTNLVSNAIKYSPGGGVVRIALRDGAGGVEIEVADQGLGISEADQVRLFEPFRRVGDRRNAIPGAGLGLFVVKQIVAAHGGMVEVRSDPGRGSTFRVRLPVSGPAAPR